MNKNIVSVYQFSLVAGSAEERFMELNAELDKFLLACDGFIYRSVAKDADDRWVDIVYWQSAEHSEKAMGIDELPAFGELMAMIDTESLSVQKAELHSNVMPDTAKA